MSKSASNVIAQAKAWLGCNEADGSHKQIIDVYNSHPISKNYKMKYTDAWCAAFVSAVAIKVGYTDIIPVECGCERMIELFKKLGAWEEDESITPKAGHIIFYDWKDDGKGDCVGKSGHVGIVERVSNGKVYVIEGNYSNAVKRRTLSVNGKYIRGYGVPKYDTETASQEEVKADSTAEKKEGCEVNLPMLRKGYVGASAKALQMLLIGNGYSCGNAGVDGHFGNDTDKAVRAYQKAKGLEIDGIVGTATWSSLLK